MLLSFPFTTTFTSTGPDPFRPTRNRVVVMPVSRSRAANVGLQASCPLPPLRWDRPGEPPVSRESGNHQ